MTGTPQVTFRCPPVLRQWIEREAEQRRIDPPRRGMLRESGIGETIRELIAERLTQLAEVPIPSRADEGG